MTGCITTTTIVIYFDTFVQQIEPSAQAVVDTHGNITRVVTNRIVTCISVTLTQTNKDRGIAKVAAYPELSRAGIRAITFGINTVVGDGSPVVAKGNLGLPNPLWCVYRYRQLQPRG